MNIRQRLLKGQSLVDIIAILLFLILGIGGVTIRVAPHWTLPIFVPMLTQRDWPREETAFESEVYRIGLGAEPHLHYRTAPDTLYRTDTYIHQIISWQKDANNALSLWRNAANNVDGTPVTLTLPPGEPPNYLLSCIPPGLRSHSCRYYAQAGHWFVSVHFVSSNDNPLTVAEMEQMIVLLNRRLMRRA